MRRFVKDVFVRAILGTVAGAAICVGASGASAQTGDAEPSDQDIVVTAQKREETLIEIPMSISVVGEDLLARRQATSLKDLQALVPGLNLQTSSAPGVGRIIMRGINTGGAGATVGVYVDDTPFGSSTGLIDSGPLAGDFDTLDIARIEVLKGPQGTLYGASALGGVLKYVTSKPSTDRFEAAMRAGIESVKGGELGYSGTAMINVPLGATLAVRASGFYRNNGGFVDSIGTAGSIVKPDYNGSRIYGGRISALWAPTDRLSVRLSAHIQNIDGNGPASVEVDPDRLTPLYGALSNSQFANVYDHIRYRLYNGTVDFDLGFAKLNASTSYGTFDISSQHDIVLDLVGAVTEILGNPADRPLGIYPDLSTTQRKFTQEVHVSSLPGSDLEWLVGGYYTRETGGIFQIYHVFDVNGKTAVKDMPLTAMVDIGSVYKEYAGFANMTWHLADRFDVSLGARYSRNEQGASQSSDGILIGGPADLPRARSAENVFTYSVAPHFKFSEHAALYARVAKGYRPGGPNVMPLMAPAGAPRTYASDSLISYETGFKGDFSDRRFSLDVSAFYLKWNGIQLLTSINGTGVTANGGGASSKGVELATVMRPFKALTVSINGAYTDARLTADTPAGVGGLKGDPLPYTPKWSGAASVDYEKALSDNLTLFGSASLRFVGKQPVNFDTDYRALNGRRRVLPSYEVIDLTLGGRIGRWSLEAFVKNAGNSRGLTSVSSEQERGGIANGAALAAIIRPRTVGIAFGAGF